MEAAQILTWPSLCVYVASTASQLLKRTCRNCVSAHPFGHSVGAEFTALMVRVYCESVAPVAMRRDFSSLVLVAWPLGLSCGFSPHLLHMFLQRLPQSTSALPSQGRGRGDDGSGMRCLLWEVPPSIHGDVVLGEGD